MKYEADCVAGGRPADLSWSRFAVEAREKMPETPAEPEAQMLRLHALVSELLLKNQQLRVELVRLRSRAESMDTAGTTNRET